MFDKKLVMIPGPTPVHSRILNVLSEPTASHVDPDFVMDFKKALENFLKVIRGEKAQAFLVAGGGTLAMEMAVVNTLEPADKLLVISHGYFGKRFVELASRFEIEVEELTCPWGQYIEPEKLTQHLEENKVDAVTVTHVDTSTGVKAPARDYAPIIKESGALFILDGVCATGGCEEDMDGWGIDILLTAPQKAFGVPPGLAVLAASERALAKREKFEPQAYYADFKMWLPIMEDPSSYYSTPAVNEIRAFKEATEIILEEGLDSRFRRHKELSKAFRRGFSELGFSTFTQEKCLAETLSILSYSKGVDDQAFRQGMYKRGVVVAGGLGQTSGNVFRLGHMGNIGHSELVRTLKAASDTLRELGHPVDRNQAVRNALALSTEE